MPEEIIVTAPVGSITVELANVLADIIGVEFVEKLEVESVDELEVSADEFELLATVALGFLPYLPSSKILPL